MTVGLRDADPEQLETLMQARHAAEEALRSGDGLAEATGLPVSTAMEMLALS